MSEPFRKDLREVLEGCLIQTALRETFEEVGLEAELIHPLGLSPTLFTVTS